MRKTVIFNISFVLIGCFLSFIALEVFLRLANYQSLIIDTSKPSVNGYFWICDSKMGYRNRPNGSFFYSDIISKPIITTDKNGYRDGYDWSYNSNSPIIVFVGDSAVFCAEVADEDTGPSEVAKLLSKEFKVRVLNAGVRSYNTIQAKRMLEECLERFPEITVAVYVYCDNDYYENMIPDMYYPARTPTASWSNGKLEVVEVKEPTVPWGQSFVEYEQGRHRGLRQKISEYTRSSSVVVHQSLLAVDQIKKYFRESVIERARREQADEVLIELLRQMKYLCEKRGVTFFATSFFPGLPKWHFDCTDFHVISKQAGVHFVSIKEHFVDTPTTYMGKKVDGRFDPHYNHQGTKTFAAALAPTLKTALAQRYSRSRHVGHR